MTDISIRNLCVAYTDTHGRRKEAVRNVSMEVSPGEVVSIVGPSGCGKTSILRSLLGEVAFDGECELSQKRSSDLCYLQQSPVLLPWRTALENAAMGQEVRGRMTWASILRVKELLDDFGLGGKAMGAFPSELSTGMQQRVAIARALESSPKIMLCDEPFSAIDFITRLRLNRIFRQRCGSHVSVLMVTHNIDEAIYLSSRVYVMSGTPGSISAVVEPRLGSVEDPVRMRELPEFERYFDKIWKAMRSQ